MKQAPHPRRTLTANVPQFDFGTSSNQRSKDDGTTEGIEFLPAVNFDDFHTSIVLGGQGSTDSQLREQEAEQTGQKVRSAGFANNKTITNSTAINVTTADPVTRIARSGSFLRRQNSTTHQGEQLSRIDIMGPPAIPPASRSRRQSQFSTSTSNTHFLRPPRKSVGPGILTSSSSEYELFREVLPSKIESDQATEARRLRDFEGWPKPTKTNASTAKSTPVELASSTRNARAKSVQAPLKPPQGYPFSSSRTPEIPWSMSIDTSRSPMKGTDREPSTPSSGKRLSVMPGHATGLGARTISPTDARRIKRMSMMPIAPPLPQTPPIEMLDQPSIGTRSLANSPSMIPRKSVTPSSSRTTPDPSRKSYNSVISNPLSGTHSSIRNQGASLRIQQSISLSRLPTPKGRCDNISNPNEEEIPPVPAIPKAYESPKNEIDMPFFPTRKSSLPFDTSSLASISADNLSAHSSDRDISIGHLDSRRRSALREKDLQIDHNTDHPSQKIGKSLQPLRLPPINLQRLSTPTAEKIAALRDKSTESRSRPITPPPKSGPLRTPTTPMTASRASFVFRHRYMLDSTPVSAQLRSSSSHYALKSDTASFHADSSSDSSVKEGIDTLVRPKAVSPFMSSSLPKTNGDLDSLRPKPSGDRSVSHAGSDFRSGKLTGPRAQTSTKTLKYDNQSQASSPTQESHSFGVSLRQKLSINRKKSISKTDLNVQDNELPPNPPKHNMMPPPRFPASTTSNGPQLSNPSPILQLNHLRARKPPASPEAVVKHNRPRSDVTTNDLALKQVLNESSEHARIDVSKSKKLLKGSNPPACSLNTYDGHSSSNIVGVHTHLDRDDQMAEEEMKKLASKRKCTEVAARELDELQRRAVPKDKVTSTQALQSARLNIFERGEIVDFKEIFFCGTQSAHKFTGDLEAPTANFGYDDDRGDYNIVHGDHLAYRYEIVDILGKGSFGQVVRCVDHKTGGLVAIKIIRNKKRFHQQALVEVNILRKLREWVSHFEPLAKFAAPTNH